MHNSWKYGYRSHRHSPWMGFAFVFLMIMLFAKGFALLWPLLLIGLGFMLLTRGGHRWNFACDGDMGEKFKQKRDEFFEREGKSKRYYRGDEDTEPIEYI